MITFLQPLFLWLLPVAGLPFLLNLVRRRTKLRVAFPSLQLLRSLDESRARRRPKWQDVILLFLRAGAVAFVILAAAGPRWGDLGSSAPRAVFIVIDNSRTMAFEENGVSRAIRARDEARQLLASLGSDDAVGFSGAWAGDRVSWLAGNRAAVPAVSGAATDARIADAFAAAADAFHDETAGGKKPEIILFSDLRADSLAGVGRSTAYLPTGTNVTLVDVREKPGPFWNTAIAAIRIRPLTGGLFSIAVDVNQHGRPRPVTLDVNVDARSNPGIDLVSAPVTTGRFVTPGGKIALTCEGGYPGDDHYDVVLPRETGVRGVVTPGTPGGVFWRSALAAAGCEAAGNALAGPAVVVAPLNSRDTGTALAAAADSGVLVVLVPTKTDPWSVAGMKTSAFVKEPTSVGFGPASPGASSSGRFRAAGFFPLVSTGGEVVARTASGEPFIIRRRWGRGELWVILSPVGSAYTSLFDAPAFTALGCDLRARALTLGTPGFKPAVSVEDRGGTSTLDAADLAKVLPGAVVSRVGGTKASGSTGRLLAAFVAAVAFLLLGTEALLAAAVAVKR